MSRSSSDKFEKMSSLLRFSLYLTVIILCNRNRTRTTGVVIEAGVGDNNLAAPQVSQLDSEIDGPFPAFFTFVELGHIPYSNVFSARNSI
jgi:hypothetical protein